MPRECVMSGGCILASDELIDMYMYHYCTLPTIHAYMRYRKPRSEIVAMVNLVLARQPQ